MKQLFHIWILNQMFMFILSDFINFFLTNSSFLHLKQMIQNKKTIFFTFVYHVPSNCGSLNMSISLSCGTWDVSLFITSDSC